MEQSILEFEEFQTEDIMSVNHAKLAYRFTKALIPYENKYDIMPELDFALPSGNAKPDIAVCDFLPYNWIDDTIRVKTPPIIAIEILSPRQAFTDLTDKAFKIYLPSGVQSVWIVIPAIGTVSVISSNLSLKNYSEGVLKDEFTGIEVDLDLIFKK